MSELSDEADLIEAARRDPRRRLGRFLLLSELGRGGMGVVYDAYDPNVGRRVALKLMLDPDPGVEARLQREVEALGRVKHPCIVQIHEVGRAGGGPFLVMERVEGRSLLAEPLPMDVERAVGLTLALCDGLAHAHARGVLHRDLKPHNVMVGPDGRPRLLDFGLALLGDRSRLTRTGTLMGTPAYMPPEQLDGVADERTDVYGLGATLYHLLAGRPPFEGTVESLLFAVANKAPAPLTTWNALVPAPVEGVVLRCLEKDPSARYASMPALAEALSRALAGEQVERPRRRGVVLAIGAVVAAVAVGGAVVALRGPGASDVAPPAQVAVDERAEAARRAAASGEEAWLAGRFDEAARHLERAGEEGATLRALLDVLGSDDAACARAAVVLERADPPPAVTLARVIAAARRGRGVQELADRLASTRVDATPHAVALLGLAEPRVDAVRWLLPRVEPGRLTPAQGDLLARRALALLPPADRARMAGDELAAARALGGAARAASASAPALRAVVEAALDRMDTLVGDAVTAPLEVRAEAYASAARFFNVALAVDPAAEPPDAVRTLLAALRHPDSDQDGPIDQAKVAASRVVGVVSATPEPDFDRVYQDALDSVTTAGSRLQRLETTRRLVDVLNTIGHPRKVELAALGYEGLRGAEEVDYMFHHAHVLFAEGRFDEARRLLDQAIDLDPLHGDSRELRGRLAFVEDRDQEAGLHDLRLAVYDTARSRSTTLNAGRDPYLWRALILERRGELEAARESCRQFMTWTLTRDSTRKDVTHTETHARVLAKLGRRAEADAVLADSGLAQFRAADARAAWLDRVSSPAAPSPPPR